jgi:hypothetical protein
MNAKRGGPGSRRWEMYRRCQTGTCQARTILGRKVHVHSIGDAVGFAFVVFGVVSATVITPALAGGTVATAIIAAYNALDWWIPLHTAGDRWALVKMWLLGAAALAGMGWALYRGGRKTKDLEDLEDLEKKAQALEKLVTQLLKEIEDAKAQVIPACPECGETRRHPEARTYSIRGQKVTYAWFACLHRGK